MDSGASYTSSPDCSMVTHSNWSLSLGFSCVVEGTTGALTCKQPGAYRVTLAKVKEVHGAMLTCDSMRTGTLQRHDVLLSGDSASFYELLKMRNYFP